MTLSLVQDLLRNYLVDHPAERAVALRFHTLIAETPECLWRTAHPGHLTASAWIVGPGGRPCLLTEHRKLGRWLQLGGHVDGDADLERAALREAMEESGLTGLRPWRAADGSVRALDLDVHPIPAHGREPAHEHYDVRFLLLADPAEPLVVSAESRSLRWVEPTDLAAYTSEESVRRLARKAAYRLAPSGVNPPRRG